MKNSPFNQQTHFIGVLVNEELTDTLEECRSFMNQKYGCKSGHGTPIHVTLIPPFALDDCYTTYQLVETVRYACDTLNGMRKLPFESALDGFGSFAERTIYANVVTSENWTVLRDSITKEVQASFPGCIKKNGNPFKAHMSVANRDIPEGSTFEALQALSEIELPSCFKVEAIAIFTKKNNRWVAEEENIIKY